MEMNVLILEALKESHPNLFNKSEYYITMSGKNWDIEDDITVLGPPFHLSKSILGYLVPSGKAGWANNDWKWRPHLED